MLYTDLAGEGSLKSNEINKYWQVSQAWFLSEVVDGHLQAFWDEGKFSDPFQSAFRIDYETFIALMDDLHCKMDRWNATL